MDPRTATTDGPRLVEELPRSLEQILTAYAIAHAMNEYEAPDSPAKPWLVGMVSAAQWLIGYQASAPMRSSLIRPTRREVGAELIEAGRMDMPGDGRGLDDREGMYARGVYRMLAYALGYRDEVPVKLSREVASRIAARAPLAA
jgi:hypothetical protein